MRALRITAILLASMLNAGIINCMQTDRAIAKEANVAKQHDLRGRIIDGIVQRLESDDLIVDLGHTEAILPIQEQIPGDKYLHGNRIRAYVKDIIHNTRGPKVVLSRTHPGFLIKLFETEVHEISDGIVTIKGAARQPGVYAKIAVSSNNTNIDPVEACVGFKGSRVRKIRQELRGEMIDIIPWHVDPARYVSNALASAHVTRVIIDEENAAMEVIVPDEFLSIVIGKMGLNVRLASELTNWHIDVISEERYGIAGGK